VTKFFEGDDKVFQGRFLDINVYDDIPGESKNTGQL